MQHRLSEGIDPSLYDTHGLDYGIALRAHKHRDKEIRGTLRAQRDWTKHVSPVEGYNGGLGEPFSFMCVTVPECLPERLEVISYANEYAFLYDDEMENLDLKHQSGDGFGILETFGVSALSSTVNNGTRPEKQLQVQLLKEMMEIDAPRAKTSMKAWASFVQSAAKTRSSPFETLEQYTSARAIDAGELFWYGILTFGMALTIPDCEYDRCIELARPGYIALGLVNDLYSWEKEREAARRIDQDYVFNAIWVIMRESSVGEAEAWEICCKKILTVIAEFSRNVEKARANTSLSRDLRTYLEAVLMSYIGNLVWSIYCPRYRQL